MPPLILRPEDSIDPPPISEAEAAEAANMVPDHVEVGPDPKQGITEILDEAKKLRAESGKAKKPLVDSLRGSYKSATPKEPTLQIHPDGAAAQELKARGINSRTQPGLFSRRGRKDFDNLVASEMEESFPGITEATGTKWGDNYLDRDGFLDVLARDADGDDTWLYSRAEAARLEQQAADIEAGIERGDPEYARGSIEYDLDTGRQAPDGLFIDVNGFSEDLPTRFREIEPMLDQYLDQRGIDLDETVRLEIMDQLTRYGGDAEYLVELSVQRDLSAAKEMVDGPNAQRNNGLEDREAPRGNDEAGGGDSGRSERTGGSQGEGGTGDTQPVRTEPTEAGEQGLIEGVVPVTTRDRLQSQQEAPMRGGDAAADDGLFDVSARTQIDMFSDPTSPEARVVQDSVAADIRTSVEADGDFDVQVPMEDGSIVSMKASEALDYLDEGDKFSARIDLCGKGPA